MNDRGEGSILGRLAYAAGYALGRADAMLEGDEPQATAPPATPTPYPAPPPNDRAESAEEHAEATGEGAEFMGEGAEAMGEGAESRRHTWFETAAHPGENGASAAIALGTIAAGWVLGRLIRPKPINWPRAILAGAAATALADLVDSVSGPDPERRSPFPPSVEDIPRYAAGIATAAAYGAQIYPRLPGSPLTRGLIFGTVEAMVADDGGALGMLQRVAPQMRLPLGELGIHALPPRSTIASLAFGLGLGLYSAGGKRK